MKDWISENRKYIKAVLLYVYLIMGVTGIVSSFVTMFGGIYRPWTYFAMLAAATAIFCWQCVFRKYMLNIFIVLILFLSLFALRHNEVIQYVSNILTGIREAEGLSNYEITYFIIFLGILAAEFIVGVEFETKYTGLYFVLIMFIVFLNPLTGKAAAFNDIVLMIISFAGIYIINRNEKKLKSTAVAVSIIFTVFTGIAFLTASVGINQFGDELFDIADDADSYIYRGIKALRNENREDYDSGEINRGNNYQNGTPCLEVWLNKKPEEDLYLKGFEGGDYRGSQWDEADEGEFFERLAFERGWSRWGNLIDTMYKEIYYTANSSSNPPVTLKARTVTINPLLQNVKNRYFPYIGRWERLTRKENIAYVYSYYELKDLNINTANMDYENLRRYNDMQENYEPYVYENYLNVPVNMVPRTVELCRNKNFDNIDEITAFIKNELSTRASYTLTPGMAPLNEDIVEYFLFENKKGYCVHFASAATLMYRSFGIPARYVTGYKISKDEFKEQEDGTYYAEAIDRDAHAWTEIYIRDKGWIPVEVTPAANVNTAEAINYERDAGEETTAEITSEITEEESREVNAAVSDKGTVKELAVVVIAALPAAAVILRRKLTVSGIRAYDVRKLFYIITKIMEIRGIKCTGLEDDFVQMIVKEVPVLDHDEAERLHNIVLKAAYGNENCDDAERDFVYNVYKKVSDHIYGKCGILRRIYIKLLKVYC